MAAEAPAGGGRRAHFCYMYAAPLVQENRRPRGRREAIERPLNLAVESQELMHQLSKAGKAVEWRQTVASHSTFAKTLRTNLDVLHYSGHGEQGYLCGEQNTGELCPITTADVKSFLKLQEARQAAPPLVFVAACHSEPVGQVFHQAGSPHVVCVTTSEEVNDSAALNFSKQFYHYLIKEGETVANAFLTARQVVAGTSVMEAKKFRLLPEPSQPVSTLGQEEWDRQLKELHDEAPLKGLTKGHLLDRRHESIRLHPVPEAPTLVGRDLIVQDMYASLVREQSAVQLINIHGAPGVGKAATATALAAFVLDRIPLREKFDRVLYIKASEIDKAVPRGIGATDHQGLETAVRTHLLRKWGVDEAHVASSPGQLGPHLRSAWANSLFVVTHLDVEGNDTLRPEVADAVMVVASALLLPLLTGAHCSMVLTSRAPLQHGWDLNRPKVVHLPPLDPVHAGEVFLVEWVIQRSRMPKEWGGQVTPEVIKAAPFTSARKRLFHAAGSCSLLRACGGIPGVLKDLVRSSAGLTFAEDLDALRRKAVGLMLGGGHTVPPGVVEPALIQEVRAEQGAGGGAPPTGQRGGMAALAAAGAATLPPLVKHASQMGPPSFGSGPSLHSHFTEPMPGRPLSPGGRTTHFHLSVSSSDTSLPADQVQTDVEELWAALCTSHGVPPHSQSVSLPPVHQATAVWALMVEYAAARLPHAMAVRPLTTHDALVLARWVYEQTRASPGGGGGGVVLGKAGLSTAVQGRLMEWIWMMKVKGHKAWTKKVPHSPTWYLHGFLNSGEANQMLVENKSPPYTFLLRFSDKEPKSVSVTVSTQEGKAWNRRLTLRQRPPGATVASRTGSVGERAFVWEYSWPKCPPLYAHHLEDFISAHSDIFVRPFASTSSTYADGALPQPQLAHAASAWPGAAPATAAQGSWLPPHAPGMAGGGSMMGGPASNPALMHASSASLAMPRGPLPSFVAPGLHHAASTGSSGSGGTPSWMGGQPAGGGGGPALTRPPSFM